MGIGGYKCRRALFWASSWERGGGEPDDPLKLDDGGPGAGQKDHLCPGGID